jgi:hypothetical protein
MVAIDRSWHGNHHEGGFAQRGRIGRELEARANERLPVHFAGFVDTGP